MKYVSAVICVPPVWDVNQPKKFCPARVGVGRLESFPVEALTVADAVPTVPPLALKVTTAAFGVLARGTFPSTFQNREVALVAEPSAIFVPREVAFPTKVIAKSGFALLVIMH